MKIWHVRAAPSPFRVDGVSRTVWLMSLEQARLGHDVSLILDAQPTTEAITMANAVGLRLHDASATAFTYRRHIRQLLDTVPPEIVHMHSVFIPRQAALARLLNRYGIPYLVTPHAGLAPQVLARGRAKKTVYSFLRERPRLMGASAIALVTPAEEKAVRSYLPDYRGMIRWMPNPVEFSMLDPSRWNGLAERKRLVFLGRFDVLVKGVDILVDLARLLPDVAVDLYGTEEPKTLAWLRKLKKNLPSNVTFHDPIFGKEKAEILANASLYIQPSRWEGFPVSVAECLYLGVPSVITDTLDLAELFHKHELGLVVSLNPELAATQIRAALSDPQRLRWWSQRGREFAIEHFAPQAVAQNHIDLYRDVIEAQKHPAGTPVALAGGNGRGPVRPAGAHGRNGAAAHDAMSRRLVPAHIRGTLKESVSRIVERSSGLLGPSRSVRSVVLCYHSICDQPSGMTLDPRCFREHIATLREMGFEFQTFGDFVDRIMHWGSPKTNVAVLTFDDGFEDNLTHAAPILTELKVPATFFVTSGLMQQDSSVVASFRALTKFDTNYLSAKQVGEMSRAGFEVGAHTHTHPNLGRLPQSQARWELSHSKLVLEDAIGARVRSFAYPFGKRHIHYSTVTADLVREAGYSGAASIAFRSVTARNFVKIFEIPRFFITRGDGATQFRQKVSGHFDWLGSFQELSPAWLKSLVSPEDRY